MKPVFLEPEKSQKWEALSSIFLEATGQGTNERQVGKTISCPWFQQPPLCAQKRRDPTVSKSRLKSSGNGTPSFDMVRRYSQVYNGFLSKFKQQELS
jgi:hypothetical protein